MRRSPAALLSPSKLSTLILFLLLACSLLAPSAFAQGSKRKSLYDPIEEKDQDQPDQRAKWLMRGREAPKGQSAAALRLRAHRQKMTVRAAREAAAAKDGSSTTAAQATAGWVALGPAPLISDQNFYGMVSGRSTAVSVDPSDATGNTVYVAGASGGVWKSTNAANANAANVTWTPVTDQQASLTNGAVSVKPDGSVVLVGTGEPNNAIDSYYGVGILRSTDKGASWTLISSSDGGAHPFAGLGVNKFAWVPASNTVVAATATSTLGFDEGLIGNSTNRGLYLSTNAGQTWTYQAPTDGITPISVTDVVYNATAGKFFAAIRYHGVYSSTNGTSWSRLTNQPNPTVLSSANCPVTVNNNSPCPMYRGQFTVVPGRNEMYFWFIDPFLQDQGIWQSLDGGTSWKQLQPASQCTLDPDTNNPPCGMRQPFYNLELSAMPNGSGTDLYAGLVNLYKCRVNSGTQSCATIDSGVPNNWINLTQVYTCSTISGVHPDEHGLDFEIVGGNAIMYFGNDGGVYRTLDGFTKLNSGTCGVVNHFDNLNATIGSMTQFVSFSTHPTDQDTVIGGTQDNGSPATTTATSSSQFFTAFGGDGGYNAIDPITPTNWYNALTNVQIGQCAAAPSCNDNSYIEVVSSATVGGDNGQFYTPYILDPQNPSEMLVGTCRVWRGPSGGGAFNALSNNFDGTVGSCGGYPANEIDLVRGLTAGGPKDGSGFSKVVYATTEGTGPNVGSTNQFGGEVWATTTAGTTQMSRVTGTINPSNYSISSVAIDNSDATGNTAYVGVMGFNTAHVFKTITAGTSTWTDWSGSGATALPDSPVNALLVDSQKGQIYAGTDVGIFVSSTSSASWTEVGPAPGSGQAGYLPNVPVSAIRLFNSGGVKKLRVSTYGRGIWEFNLAVAPDFTLSASPSALSITPGLAGGTSTITVTDQGGFTGSVSLAASGLPSGVTASFNPTTTTSTSVLTLTASALATAGTATVTITGTSGSLTHTTTIALTVTGPPDFTLAANPATLSLDQGTNRTSAITVVPANGFAGSVTLAASGLPSGVTASFNPTTTSTTSTLTLTASNSATPGSATVTITGTSGSLVHTTAVALTVNQNFTLTTPTTPAPSPVAAGLSATSTFKVTSADGKTFASAVTFACNGLPADGTITCAFSPVALGATSPQTVTLTIKTTGPNGPARAQRQRADNRSPWLPLALPLAGIVMVGLAGRKRSRYSAIAGLSISLVLLGLLLACGGSSTPPVGVSVSPAGATVFASGLNGSTWPPQTATFTATVTNNSNTAVNWSVSPANGGSITSGGVYTAPTIAAGLPGSATITATSQADSTKTAHATVTITPTTVPGTYNNITVTGMEGPVTSAPTSPFTLTVN